MSDPRLFIALELPTAVVHELSTWRDSVLVSKEGLRPLAPGSMHVTLVFLGETYPSKVGAVFEALGLLAGSGAVPLALGSPWWLPRRRPGVLAVAVDDDDGLLRDAQGMLVSALHRRVGLVPERRIFFPHVTVARVRRGFRLRPARLAGPPGIEFAGTRVTLYQSREGYRSLHTVEL